MEGVLGIIQARMGSKRLPRKMMMKLGEEYIISWVVKRIKMCKKIDQLIVATSTEAQDDILYEFCNSLNINIFRGSEKDVLKRFYDASSNFNSKIIVRICADNPFIDPHEVDKLIDFFKINQCDYSCNHQDKLLNDYADGFGAEIFTKETLKKINDKCKDIKVREHVSLYIWKNFEEFKIKTFKAPKELAYPNLSFDIDTLKDFEKLNALVSLGVNLKSKASDIIKIYNDLYK